MSDYDSDIEELQRELVDDPTDPRFLRTLDRGDEDFGDLHIEADVNFKMTELDCDEWLVTNTGGLPELYPRLFIPSSTHCPIVTPALDDNKPCPLLDLPMELRLRIYEFCIPDKHDSRLCRWSDSHDLRAIEIPNDDAGMVVLLSSPILRCSRQLRSEALCEMFRRVELIITWLPSFPNLVRFLGSEGCALVRHLRLDDDMDLKHHDPPVYQAAMESLQHFQHLKTLYITLDGTLDKPAARPCRGLTNFYHYFEPHHIDALGCVRRDANPVMRWADEVIEWPELPALRSVRTADFVLALRTDRHTRHFDNEKELMKGLLTVMRSAPRPTTSVPISAKPQRTVSDDIAVARKSGALPFYNFMLEIATTHYEWPLMELMHRAPRSEGLIYQDCALCYFSNCYCGYHGIPEAPNVPPAALGSDLAYVQQEFHPLDGAAWMGDMLLEPHTYPAWRWDWQAIKLVQEYLTPSAFGPQPPPVNRKRHLRWYENEEGEVWDVFYRLFWGRFMLW